MPLPIPFAYRQIAQPGMADMCSQTPQIGFVEGLFSITCSGAQQCVFTRCYLQRELALLLLKTTMSRPDPMCTEMSRWPKVNAHEAGNKTYEENPYRHPRKREFVKLASFCRHKIEVNHDETLNINMT
jgi:hypothetical protein